MKRSYLSQIVGAGVLAASLAVVASALPAQAQNPNAPDTSNTAVDQDVDRSAGDRDSSGGWLGLLGLAGLAGLSRRGEEAVVYTEPNEINSSVTTQEPVRYTDPNETVTTEEAVRYRDPNEINSSVTPEEAVRYRDPNETVTTEEAVRYRDPNQKNSSDTNGTSSRY